MKFQSKDS